MPHDSCGSHLNPSRETIDTKFEKKKELQVNWQDIVSDVGRIGIRWKAGNSGIC